MRLIFILPHEVAFTTLRWDSGFPVLEPKLMGFARGHWQELPTIATYPVAMETGMSMQLKLRHLCSVANV